MTFSTFPSKLALVPFHMCHVSPKLLHTLCSRCASAASGTPVQHPATSSCPSMTCQSLQALLWPPLARKPPFCTLRVAEPLFFLAILFYFSSMRGGQESLTLAPRRQRPSPFFPGLSPELISSGLGTRDTHEGVLSQLKPHSAVSVSPGLLGSPGRHPNPHPFLTTSAYTT